MEVTITGNLIEIVKDDGTEMVINGLNIVDEGAIRWEQYNSVPPASSGNPYLTPTPTKATRYKVVLHFNDNRWEEIYLGDVTNQAGWTDDLTGANTAVADLSAALVVSGGGGGGGVSSVSASAPLSSSGGATPTISISTSGATAGEALVYNGTTITWDTVTAAPAGSDTQVLFNNAGSLGASADLIFDGSLQIGANSDVGQLQLGGATGTAVGTISSNGAMTVEGEDTTISGGNSVDVTTNGVSRLSIDTNGAWAVDGSAGTADQYLKTNGAGADPEWATINTDEITDNSTIGGGAQDLTTSLDAIATAIGDIPAPPVTSVNGDVGAVVLTASDIDITPFVLVTIDGLFASEPFKFVATGQYQRVSDPVWFLVNINAGFLGWLCSPDGGATPYESDSPKTGPFTDIRSWTNPASAVVPGNVVGYTGPTVQDALEQVAQGVPILTGNTLWVDAVYGNDSTGLANRQDRPFLTCVAAKDAAVAGDLIEVRPGTYDEKNLLKNGVNWNFHAGASVVYTGATNGSIFDDGPDGANEAVVCTICGEGVFQWTNDFGAATQDFAILQVQNPASVINMTGKRIDMIGNNFAFAWTIYQVRGSISVSMSEAITSITGSYNMGWLGGSGSISSPQILGGQHIWGGDDTSGDWFMNADVIDCNSTDTGFSLAPESNTTGALWIRAALIKSSGVQSVISTSIGKVYITAQKIWNTNSSSKTIEFMSGKLWVTSQKITSASGTFFVSEGGSGAAQLEVQEYESELVGADTGGYGCIYNEGSSLTVIGGGLSISNAGQTVKGVTHADGTTRLKGLVIDFSANDQTTSNPVVCSSSGVILDNCTLVAPAGADSIEAATAQTVASYGSYANTAVDGNVTVDGLLTVGAYVS